MLPGSIWECALELQTFLQQQNLGFAFIGGLAVQRWGQPRMTDDIDLTVVIPFGTESQLARTMLNRYQSRHPKPMEFALEARILLLRDTSGIEIDLSIGGMPFEHRMLERSSEWGVPGGGQIRTCGAEDLVVLKGFADRSQDWIDVENIVRRQGNKLDRKIMLEELGYLAELKEQPELLHRLQSIFDKSN